MNRSIERQSGTLVSAINRRETAQKEFACVTAFASSYMGCRAWQAAPAKNMCIVRAMANDGTSGFEGAPRAAEDLYNLLRTIKPAKR